MKSTSTFCIEVLVALVAPLCVGGCAADPPEDEETTESASALGALEWKAANDFVQRANTVYYVTTSFAEAGYSDYGDVLYIHDRAPDGKRVAIHWRASSGRQGICYYTGGYGGGGFCNLSFAETTTLILRVGRCDADQVNCSVFSNWGSWSPWSYRISG